MKFPAETVKFSTGNAFVLCPVHFPRGTGYALIIKYRWVKNHLSSHTAATNRRGILTKGLNRDYFSSFGYGSRNAWK